MPRGARRPWASSAGPRRPGSRGIHVNVRIEPRWTYPQVRRAALALARDVERRAPSIATSKWWKEERHGVFLDYNQNAKDRTVASAYSVRPLPDARVSFPLRWDEVADVVAEDFTLATVPGLYAARGDAGRRHRRRGGLARRAAGAVSPGRGRGPGRRALAAQLRQAGGRAAAGPAVAQAPRRRRVRGPRPWTAARRPRSRLRVPRPSPPGIRTPACRPTGRARDPRPPAAAGHRSR